MKPERTNGNLKTSLLKNPIRSKTADFYKLMGNAERCIANVLILCIIIYSAYK